MSSFSCMQPLERLTNQLGSNIVQLNSYYNQGEPLHMVIEWIYSNTINTLHVFYQTITRKIIFTTNVYYHVQISAFSCCGHVPSLRAGSLCGTVTKVTKHNSVGRARQVATAQVSHNFIRDSRRVASQVVADKTLILIPFSCI